MKLKSLATTALALTLLLALAACGKTQTADESKKTDSTIEQTGQTETSGIPTTEETPTEGDSIEDTTVENSTAENTSDSEAWKTDFEKSLLENYGVSPDHYEDLGDGIYQVYVEINGNIVPFVTVDSSTGDYHG